MKLRWKYFISLLVASLVPMAAVTVISQQASKNLGRSISAQTQKALMETVKREIVSATENYALITRRSKSSYEFALHALIREAGIILNLPSPELTDIYFAKDFEDPETAPVDLASSPVHMKILEDGGLLPKMISYDHPNFLLAPGVNRVDVRDDIARFTSLSPALKGIAGEMVDSLFWIYVSSESGVHISYPGHGGYPREYDPRQRPWYIRARKNGAITWGPPIVDATTRQLTFTLSAPFFKPDGSVAGVAAIDILIPNILLKNLISSQWSKNMKSFLVGQEAITEGEKNKLWILSQDEQAFSAAHLAEGPGTAISAAVRNKDLHELTRRFKSQKSGSFEMPYRGVDSVWAFASIFPDLHFVIVAPKSIVMGLSKEVGESFSSYTRGQTRISIAAVCIIILLVSGLALFFSRVNTRKLMSIVYGFKRLGKGDFTARLATRFNDERDLIVKAFNQIVPKIEEHMRMSNALGLAHEVQQSLLPQKDPSLSGFDIAGASIYCDETGGDYYDFIETNRGGHAGLAVMVGDVSGHGVSSALLMATARALIMQRSSMPGDPADIINDVNRSLSLDTAQTGNFMTFFYCELSERGTTVQWVRAGHDPALIYDPFSDTFDELRGQGMALGFDKTFQYDSFHRRIKPGEVIMLGTDGIWEMHNRAGEMFGKQALREVIRNSHTASARKIVDTVTDELERFRGDQAPEDDITMVVIKVDR
jgi:sigma-B regulation protein RsbU (phosphoserine phosphatase)